LTVRISFNAESIDIGEPKIVFMQSSGGSADDVALADSMMPATRECTPRSFLARCGDRGVDADDPLHRLRGEQP
jgi:hypothetical protein